MIRARGDIMHMTALTRKDVEGCTCVCVCMCVCACGCAMENDG